ncbi:MAG TPA: hypothetical protein VHR42_06655 [Clostridia bacterium]|nr:hypothetical protein [Clostridia bacterium]
MKALKNILIGILCGVLFVSAFYWSLVLYLLVSNSAFYPLVLILCSLFANVLIGFLLSAESCRQILYKWLISLPAGIVTFLLYRQSNFVYYWLNRIWPGYGDLSAGGGFAAFTYLVFFCLCFLVAVAIGVYLTKRKRHKHIPAPGAHRGGGL